jgi:dTMP kinase
MVICDRYYHASMAYQGYGRGIPLDFIRKLTDLVCSPYRPDLTFLLDIEPEVGLARARARNHARAEDEGRFEAEDLEFYNKVRDGYLELASEDERIQLIYADRPIEAVHRHILTLCGFD